MRATESVGQHDSPHTQWCVVYDRRTGAVVHIHQNIAVSSNDACSASELESAAIEQADRRLDREFLSTARPADDTPLDFNARYRVDLESGSVRREPLSRSELRPG
jgi:hypothetical protein